MCEVTDLESPVFKLESVVRQRPSAETLEDFEGPLDLILYLLSKNKIEIQDIPIALILDQYLEYLDRRQQLDLEVASDFAAMAAHLMYIKTRMLLSLEDEEAQSEMDLLIKSLEERRNNDTYQRVKSVVDRMGALSEFGRDIMTKNPEPVERGKVFLYHHSPEDLVRAFQSIQPVERGKVFLYHHSPEDLVRAFQSIQERLERSAPPSATAFEEIVRREPYPVADKAAEILGRLRTGGITRFLLLFRGSRSRSELVATFLAVLELCRARLLKLAGGESDCTVAALSGETDTREE